jgi:hypothetical protein
VQRGQQIWRAGIKATGVPAAPDATAPRARNPGAIPAPAGQHPDLHLGWLKAYASGARPNAGDGPDRIAPRTTAT